MYVNIHFIFLGNKEFSALSVLIWGLFRCLSVHYWESSCYPTTIIVSYDLNISLIFYVNDGSHVSLVFTLQPRDSTLQYKRCVHLWNNYLYIIILFWQLFLAVDDILKVVYSGSWQFWQLFIAVVDNLTIVIAVVDNFDNCL